MEKKEREDAFAKEKARRKPRILLPGFLAIPAEKGETQAEKESETQTHTERGARATGESLPETHSSPDTANFGSKAYSRRRLRTERTRPKRDIKDATERRRDGSA